MCEYCSSGLSYQENSKIWYISLDMIKYISYMLEKYLDIFNIYILILGGEPLLHPQLEKIIHIFEHNKNVKKLVIITNNSIEIDSIFKKPINIPIHFTFSFHADTIYKKFNFNKQLNIFISNIKKLEKILKNFSYKIEILHDMTQSLDSFNKLKNILSESLDHNKIEISPIHSTLWTQTTTDKEYYTNPMYNKEVNINGYFAIIKNLNTKMYDINNNCQMVNYITSLYDISFWKKAKKKYYIKKVCNQQICLCRYCLGFKNFDKTGKFWEDEVCNNWMER